MDNERESIKARFGEDLRDFKENFSFNEKELNKFLEFVKNNDVEISDKQYQKDKNYIKTRLKAYVARDIWKNEGWFLILLEEDNQFQKALELFPEAEKITKL
jgi:carboxyl-terminal processing protease